MQQAYIAARRPLQLLGNNWENMWFDKAHQHFVLLKNKAFYLWLPDDKSAPVSYVHEPTLPDGIMLVKISLDLKLIAVQFSSTRLLVFDTSNDVIVRWAIDIKSPNDNRILPGGLVWSEHSGNSQDLIIVTTKGLEMYKISSVRAQCKLSRTVSQGLPLHALFWYEPNHRIMLLASPIKAETSGGLSLLTRRPSVSSPSSSATSVAASLGGGGGGGGGLPTYEALAINGYFFKSDKSDMPKLELPPPDKTPRIEFPAGLASSDVVLLTLYGGLYCAVHYCSQERPDILVLYNVTRAAITPTHTLAMHTMSKSVKMSISDNLLFVHCLASKTSIIFDVLCKPTKSSPTVTVAGCVMEVIDPVCSAAPLVFENDVKSRLRASSSVSNSSSSSVSSQQQQQQLQPNSAVFLQTFASASLDNDDASSAVGEASAAFLGLTAASTSSDGSLAPSPLTVQGTAVSSSKTSSSRDAKSTVVATTAALDSDNDEPSDWDAVGVGSRDVVALQQQQAEIGGDEEVDDKDEEEFDQVVASNAKSQGLQKSPNSEEAYSDECELLLPGWIWDEKRRCIWRLRSCLRNVADSIYDPRHCIAFLARRGQLFRAPKAVYQSVFDGEEGPEAKRLMLRKVGSSLEGLVSLSWLEVLFKALVSPYASEFKRIDALQAEQAFYSQSVDAAAAGTSNNSSPTQQQQAPNKSRSSSTSPNLQNSPITYERQSNLGGSGGERSSSFSHMSTTATDGANSSASVMARSMFAFNNVLSGARETFAGYYPIGGLNSRADTEPLEPAHALYVLLPDITAVGNIKAIAHPTPVFSKHQNNSSSSGCTDRGSLSSPTPSSSSLMPLTTRRDSEGNLVVSQTELISHIWLPKILSGVIDLEYYSWALSSYLAVLRGAGVESHPALSMLLLKLFSARKKYMEIARLLQLQFFPDAAEVAMTALELCDVIADNNGSLLTQPHGVLEQQLQSSAIANLQQVGLDMLWRLQERTTVVRWLLGHGKVMEAISLCQKRRGQWRTGLSPASIPGADFFSAAVMALHAKHPILEDEEEEDEEDEDEESDERKDSLERAAAIAEKVDVDDVEEESMSYFVLGPGERVELLHTVYKFIREWDHTCINASAATGKSRLACQTQFPEHLFSEEHALIFIRLFGFVST